MSEFEMLKTSLMGGYDKEEVQELVQRMRDEMAEAQVNFRKQLAEKDEKIAELQKRIELKDAYQVRMEENIKEKYQKYIDNYESIGKLVFDAQLKAESMEKETQEKCDQMIAEAEAVLAKTPEMLPVLKEAGVVDSGGQGLIQVIKGCIEGLKGKVVDIDAAVTPSVSGNRAAKTATGAGSTQAADIRFGYCTEFIINAEKPADETTEQELKDYLSTIGDSLVVVADDDIVKIHVHTNDPGLAIQKALTYGSLSRIKIDNMREEHQEKLIKDSERLAAQQKAEEEAKEKKEEPRKKYGFIAVSVGEGLSEIFKGIGADYIIEGGQTMNPSTEDMLEAIEKVHAETVYILPNNKNIILAAEQAKSLSEDTKVYVVPSKTVPQGITALINFAPDLTAEENMEQMSEEMSHVKTAQITYAVRNTSIDGMEIAEGDIMGIGDSGMLAVGKNIEETAMESLRKMVDDESELVTIYYGEDVTEEDAEAFCEKARKEFTSCEFECQNGGQPIYYYMISVE